MVWEDLYRTHQIFREFNDNQSVEFYLPVV
ncbi:hypothetical protein P872_13135 [Rhodonellum psychrophilum GCM71 = DSM 17998]|uniref:Uncharacterized protein n=1 Tax=Rhodonellum psychrophilum GCM71 = DSM 17998 TaxID=1123057 RepID=U5BJF6_9BACT|nr:hypothetical protein P872_13135 [Rhodonellum psychrophilum GCM71 = DSM 17998]